MLVLRFRQNNSSFAKWDGVGGEFFERHGRQTKMKVFHNNKTQRGDNVKQYIFFQSIVKRLID